MEVLKYPHPLLLQPCSEVAQFGEQLRAEADELLQLMVENRGLGLAAPQVGRLKHLLVVNLTGEKQDEKVLVNPRLLESSGSVMLEEGCLSFPGIMAKIVREERIKVAYQDIQGETQEMEADGVLARVVRHEMDHLDGVLFVTRMSPAERRANRRHLSQLEQEYAQQGRGRRNSKIRGAP